MAERHGRVSAPTTRVVELVLDIHSPQMLSDEVLMSGGGCPLARLFAGQITNEAGNTKSNGAPHLHHGGLGRQLTHVCAMSRWDEDAHRWHVVACRRGRETLRHQRAGIVFRVLLSSRV